jgi:hypothetical protein
MNKGGNYMSCEHEKVHSGLICERDLCKIREAVCIQVEKVYDSCQEKDCIENARVYFPHLTHSQKEAINHAFNGKIRKAEIRDVITDIESVPFKRGFFNVDVKFIIDVFLDFITNITGTPPQITPVRGEISFDKKVILFGSEGNVKIFKTHFENDETDTPLKCRLQQDNLPIAKVEVAEPIALNAKIRGILDKLFEEESDDKECCEDSRCILTKRVFVTVGIFSIIKLVRFVQLLIPAFNFCFPNKECISATEEKPCELFEAIEFPFDEFFPPQIFDFPGALEAEEKMVKEAEEHKHHHHHHEHH